MNSIQNKGYKKSVFLNERFLKHFSVSSSFRSMKKRNSQYLRFDWDKRLDQTAKRVLKVDFNQRISAWYTKEMVCCPCTG